MFNCVPIKHEFFKIYEGKIKFHLSIKDGTILRLNSSLNDVLEAHTAVTLETGLVCQTLTWANSGKKPLMSLSFFLNGPGTFC